MAFRTGYAAKAEEFNQMFPISDSSMAGIGQITADQKASKRGYFEARNIYRSPTALGYALGNLTAAGVADDYMVVSMGDEIALAVPSGPSGADLFKQFCSENHYPSVRLKELAAARYLDMHIDHSTHSTHYTTSVRDERL